MVKPWTKCTLRKLSEILFFIGSLSLLILSLAACNTNTSAPAVATYTPVPANNSENPSQTENAYPSTNQENQVVDDLPEGYPAPTPYFHDVSAEPPNPERDLPEASPETAVVGGVLIWEIVDTGFQPLVPNDLILAEVLTNSNNESALIRTSATSPKAQLYPTGIFVFQGIPPGQYGLVVDLGYTQFPIADDTGDVMLLTIEAGNVIDLGQIITEVPNS
jgi:hypothetical protein